MPTAPTGNALRRCVGDPEPFLRDHWSQAPLYRPRSDPDGFADLFTIADVDHLVATAALRIPAFRMVRGGAELPPPSYTRSGRVGSKPIDDLVDPGKVYRHFDRGATIVLQSLHRYWLPLTRLCRDLERSLTHPVQVNAYVTPPSSRGLGLHADGHDVFVLQVGGRKRWEVYRPGHRDDPKAPGERLLDVVLEPGDCLYVPVGFPHAVWTERSASAHLTVGVLTYKWHELLRQAVLQVLDDEPAFSQALPPGFADEPGALAGAAAERLGELQRRLGKLDHAELAATMARRFWSSRPPILTGQLQQLLALEEVSDATVIWRRAGSVCDLQRDGAGRPLLELGDRRVSFPAWVEPALHALLALLERERFAVADLAGQLDRKSRLVLVRRLIREGLLESDVVA
ncbi:MAG TPA: cupin domain-containing protein [Actinomycetes bacterium]|jgi:ribosomal protein L16 Arg81 hydroxylase|nr:cupin domain-containing protein [Actinomycetes bacterium]